MTEESERSRTVAQILQHERRKQWRKAQIKAEHRLTERFNALNRELFDGRLPPHVVRQVPARVLELAAGRYHRKSRTILISEDARDHEETLKHEMCHVRAPNHGASFRAELRRLAERGDTWAARELAELEPTEDHIRGILLHLVDRNPLLTWTAGRATIAAVFGLAVRELLRRAPWAREEWHCRGVRRRRPTSPSLSEPRISSESSWLEVGLREHFNFLED